MTADDAGLGSSFVQTPDGLQIHVRTGGNPQGREVLFIHGFSQCQLSWERQFGGKLAEEFRLVAYDLRGHGSSEKPSERKFYVEGERWADEMAAVMNHAGLKRPLVVAWSYAGRIVADYLQKFGTSAICGINLVGSKTRTRPEFTGPRNAYHQARMCSNDVGENIDGTIAFLRSCATNWQAAEFERHLAFNMLVPPQVRGHLLSREFNADAIYGSMDIPLLVTHGTDDQVVPVAAGRHANAVTPGSSLSIYEGIGHAPFIEAQERFDAELAEFVRGALGA